MPKDPKVPDGMTTTAGTPERGDPASGAAAATPERGGPASGAAAATASQPSTPSAAVEAISGAHGYLTTSPEQLASAFGQWAGSLARRPALLAAEVLQWQSDQLRILAGASPVAPDPKDKRFADPAWQHPVWHRVAQSYLATCTAMLRSVDGLGLDAKRAGRARFALTQMNAAMAPTNTLAGNPAAMKKAWHTRGRSLLDGSRHLAHDVRNNGGMPSQVDSRPFRIGENIAATPGAVVYRSEVFELLQYEPQTPEIAALPTIVVPPQINRYYFIDMAPGRSFVEYCVGRGLPMFMMSWRNPRPGDRGWNLDTYAGACREAIAVAKDLYRSDQVNLMGFCSGGMTAAALLSHLNQRGDSSVNAAGMAVSLIDSSVSSSLDTFMSDESVLTSLARSKRRGIVDGRSLSRVFSWVRPDDLVWNYWVSNYLMGENPPAFDVLAWNADATNMPAGLQADFLRIWQTNAMLARGSFQLLGTPLDLSTVKNDMYVVGAQSDHLVPWTSAYAATQALGGSVRFVLSRSGHIQALVNPPGNPKASFYVNPEQHQPAEQWLAGATSVGGSWWEDWADWISERSGPPRSRPKALGNRRHPVLEPAPGRYVAER